MMLLNGNENAGRVEARGAAGARERRGSARETFAGPRRRVPLILGRTSSTNRILAEAYSTPTTNPRMRITRDIPRHHIAVDTERCSVVVRARTGAAAGPELGKPRLASLQPFTPASAQASTAPAR